MSDDEDSYDDNDLGSSDPDSIVQRGSIWTECDLTSRLQSFTKVSNFKLTITKIKENPDRKSNQKGRLFFQCTRGGKARKKPDIDKLKSKTSRERNSFKCGCAWSVTAYLESDGTYRVTTCHLVHTGGCTPSPQQFAVSAVKSTNKKIPNEILSSMNR